jgi:hypothetical protein
LLQSRRFGLLPLVLLGCHLRLVVFTLDNCFRALRRLLDRQLRLVTLLYGRRDLIT